MCNIFSVKPVKKPDPSKLGAKIDDYWDAAKNDLLKNPKTLLDGLIHFEKEKLTDALIDKITPIVQNEIFKPEEVRKGSVAVEAMCKWVHAMYNFFHVNKQVDPLRIQVAQLNAELEIVQTALKEAKARLKEVTDKIEDLERGYEECIQKQETLKERINDC